MAARLGAELQTLLGANSPGPAAPRPATLLELVCGASDVFDSEREVVDVAIRLLEAGRVELVGNFRGVPIAAFAE